MYRSQGSWPGATRTKRPLRLTLRDRRAPLSAAKPKVSNGFKLRRLRLGLGSQGLDRLLRRKLVGPQVFQVGDTGGVEPTAER